MSPLRANGVVVLRDGQLPPTNQNQAFSLLGTSTLTAAHGRVNLALPDSPVRADAVLAFATRLAKGRVSRRIR